MSRRAEETKRESQSKSQQITLEQWMCDRRTEDKFNFISIPPTIYYGIINKRPLKNMIRLSMDSEEEIQIQLSNDLD